MVVPATTVEMTDQELREFLDREARSLLGMSGDEMLSRYVDGTLDDPGEVTDLVILAHTLLETH